MAQNNGVQDSNLWDRVYMARWWEKIGYELYDFQCHPIRSVGDDTIGLGDVNRLCSEHGLTCGFRNVVFAEWHRQDKMAEMGIGPLLGEYRKAQSSLAYAAPELQGFYERQSNLALSGLALIYEQKFGHRPQTTEKLIEAMEGEDGTIHTLGP